MRERPEATPASVASLLRAFYAEPAAHRPAFLHDPDGFAGGEHIFRFALGRFPPELALSSPEGAALRQAACAFVRQVCFWDGANHYQVLGLRRDASADAVKENYRLLVSLIHPDRREPDLETDEPWPTGCVQRANRAYEVLGDPARRALYDADAARAAPGPGAVHASSDAVERRRAPVRRIGARAGIVVCAVLGLGMAQLAFFGGVETPDWLPRAAPRATGEPSAEPRFITFARASELLTEMIEAPKLASLSPPVSIEAPHAAPAPRAVPALPEEREAVSLRIAKIPIQAPGTVPVAAVSASPRSEPGSTPEPIVIAQATVPAAADTAPPKAPELSNKDVELLLARMVSYYEAGDTDRFMGLFDGRLGSFFRTMQARSAYDRFFRGTKQRRLRIANLTWNTAERTAYARGKAEVVADFVDGASRLDRSVDMEIDITLREGGARISRLSLFPNGP